MTDEKDNGLRRLPPREKFIELIGSSVSDPLVLAAFRTVDRADFIESKEGKSLAYEDAIIDLGEGSSISQPVLVAQMMENLHLEGGERVLEVGTGSGYGAALLSKCTQEVYTIEYNQNLAETASERLRRLNFDNIQVVTGDGALGVPEASPFDAIIITAACRDFPLALVKQLAERGRILAPIGKDPQHLELILGIKMYGRLFCSKPITSCYFHPLISEMEGGFSNDYLERLFRLKRLLFEAQAKLNRKTPKEFLQKIREEAPHLQVVSDRRIIELLLKIPPADFDFYFEHLKALEEEAKRE